MRLERAPGFASCRGCWRGGRTTSSCSRAGAAPTPTTRARSRRSCTTPPDLSRSGSRPTPVVPPGPRRSRRQPRLPRGARTARHVVTNIGMPGYYRKPPRHVLPADLARHAAEADRLRHPRSEFAGDRRYFERLGRDVASWDFLVSPNPFSTEIFRRAFRYEGEILETGYPRNDLLTPRRRATRAGRPRRARHRGRDARDPLRADVARRRGRSRSSSTSPRSAGGSATAALLLRTHRMRRWPRRRARRHGRSTSPPIPTSATSTSPPTSSSPTTRRRCSTSRSPASRSSSSPTTSRSTATSRAASTSTSSARRRDRCWRRRRRSRRARGPRRGRAQHAQLRRLPRALLRARGRPGGRARRHAFFGDGVASAARRSARPGDARPCPQSSVGSAKPSGVERALIA